MTNSPNQPNLPLHVTPPAPQSRMQVFVRRFGEFIRSSLVILFWSLVAAAALVGSFIILKGIWWGARLIQTALGMS